MRALVFLSLFFAPFFQSFAAECSVTLEENFLGARPFSQTQMIKTELGDKNDVEFPGSTIQQISYTLKDVMVSPGTGVICIEHNAPLESECGGNTFWVENKFRVGSSTQAGKLFKVSVECRNL